MIVPMNVPDFTLSLFVPALYVGLITGFIGLLGISFQKNDLSALILTDIVGVAMLIVVAAVGTDLAEALILPGLVVELAEIMAISEILITREMRKKGEGFTPIKTPDINFEVFRTAPRFVAIVLIVYGIFLTGFTGGAVAGAGILFYILSKKARGLDESLWEGIAGVSGITWCLWLAGFLIFFISPPLWLLALFMSGCGILVKVASKMGLIGVLSREELKES